MALTLQPFDQVDDLRLNGDVEGRDRLVRHDEVGLGGERARNADALLLATRELVRVAVDEALAEADRGHQFANHVPHGVTGAEAVRVDRLRDDLPDGHARVERRVRVLEDHLHVPALAAQLGVG